MHCVRDAYNVSAPDQAIAAVLLNHPEHRARTLAEISRLMQLLKARLNGIAARSKQAMTVYPSVTNFVLVRLEDADAVSAAMHDRGISLRQFDRQLIRISVAPEETLNRVLDLLEETVC